MKIIQSFWSKPAFHNMQAYSNSRKFGGWPNVKYFMISSLFSCLTIRRHHKKVELYTDNLGYNFLIDKFSLPYDDVFLNLNSLEGEDHRLWALGKLLTIKSQTIPFLHLDNDIYIWDKFPKNNLSTYVLAQSSMPMPLLYIKTLDDINSHFDYIPIYLRESQNIANIGIIGGNNIDFYQNYCSEAIIFLEKNRHNLEKIEIGRFNQILDEFLFICLSGFLNQEVSYHVDSSKDITPFESVMRFNLTPLIDKYVHLVGLAKQNYFACEQLELRLKYEFPNYYKSFLKNINEHYPEDIEMGKHEQIRKEKMLEVIKFLYSLNIEKLKLINLKLDEDLEFLEITNELDMNDVKYILKGYDNITGKTVEKNLSGKDIFLGYFTTQATLNDVLEDLRLNMENNLELYELNLIDWITEKIFITGEIIICN